MLHLEKKLAVLIDAENTRLTSLEAIITELSKYGYLIVKRAYGDWASSALKNWKEKLNELAIQPIQQFSYTQGKNSSDAALIIDAMDLLYSNKFDAFAIISSDSDFTRLATRLKESQFHVYGVGERQTPISFRNACDDFIYIDVLVTLDSSDTEEKTSSTLTDKTLPLIKNQWTRQQLCMDTKLINSLRNAAKECSDENGWALLGLAGSLIKRQFPDFDSRNYGYSKLSTLIEATTLFEFTHEKMKGTNATRMFYRDKKRQKA
ncbi:NYN domain-containing protein [Methylomonas sp. EFPC3]|uniref:NYN domain-containing protein n=1 Tax=Methylomonas sp. EFPC3 TaxID=3021710 RepID=UPI0024172A67|nr:NYN domain-containing protein [Methylomonas sp. EFPC3]WFP51033.1 NYN domain-containing protein [Methylomonas sp. EFPC3]